MTGKIQWLLKADRRRGEAVALFSVWAVNHRQAKKDLSAWLSGKRGADWGGIIISRGRIVTAANRPYQKAAWGQRRRIRLIGWERRGAEGLVTRRRKRHHRQICPR